LQQTKTELTRT